jgi:hypothetical protein
MDKAGPHLFADMRWSPCRGWVNNGYGGRSTGTSVVPQTADDFGATRKSAELGQQRTLALHKRSARTRHRILRIGQTVLLTPPEERQRPLRNAGDALASASVYCNDHVKDRRGFDGTII